MMWVSLANRSNAIVSRIVGGLKEVPLRSDSCCLHNTCVESVMAHTENIRVYLTSINAMAPSPESTILFIPAFLLIGLALWTTVAIDAVNIFTFGLIIARGHTSNFAKILFLPGTKLIVVIVAAIEICACVWPLQIENVAEFELLNSLDIFPRDSWIKLVNSLTKPVPINARNRLSHGWLRW